MNTHEEAAALFAQALQLHRAGQLEKAEPLYRQVLAIAPRHTDSLNLLGIVAFQTHRLDLAEDLARKAIAINPAIAAFHSGLGNVRQAQGRLEEAAGCYATALELQPDSHEAHNNLGNLRKDQGRLEDAAACYRQALGLKPDFPQAHNNLGLVLHEEGRLDEAVALYRRAIELQPDYPEALNNLGLALQEQERLEEAMDCYRKAIALRPQYQLAHGNLGNALRDMGRFEEAIVLHEKALAMGEDRALSFYGLSSCRKFGPADRPLIARIAASLDDAKLSDAKRSMLHFALGKIFDDLAEHETAIGHFDKANRLEHRRNHFDAAAFSAMVDWLIECFPRGALPSPDASDSQLPLLIVGLPRSGTTLVEQILASHPRVAAGGERNFWLQRSEAIRRRAVRQLDRGAEQVAIRDYLGLLTEIGPGAARVTDKMPYNFLLLGLVHRLFPQARIIHCRRSPIDTALSIYFTRFNRMHEFAYHRSDIVLYIQAYQRLMAHWRALLPAARFLEMNYEKLVAAPEENSRRILDFCGLEWDAACLDFHRTDRPIVTSSAWQARQPMHGGSIERWRRYEPWLGELRKLLP